MLSYIQKKHQKKGIRFSLFPLYVFHISIISNKTANFNSTFIIWDLHNKEQFENKP